MSASITSPRTPTPQELPTHLGDAQRTRAISVGLMIATSWILLLCIYMGVIVQQSMRGVRFSLGEFLLSASIAIASIGVLLLAPKRPRRRSSAVTLPTWLTLMVLSTAVAVGSDGGWQSPLSLFPAVLVIYAALMGPLRFQALAIVLVITAMSAAVLLGSPERDPAAIIGILGAYVVLAYVATVLSSRLEQEKSQRVRLVHEADSRAGLLETVARAARRVSSLDASHVLGGALAGAMELGAYEAEIWLHEAQDGPLKLQRRVGTSVASPNESVAKRLYTEAVTMNRTAQVDAQGDTFVGAMVHQEGKPLGLLLVRTDRADGQDPLVVECLELLAAQVSAGLDVARNVAERRGLEERLAHWAFHDSLTDLPNRVLFADRLELALARTARDSSEVAVLFLDLDGFKEINDEFGHNVGDQLLIEVARRLHSCLRPNDTLARYGGDEFVVLIERIETIDTAKMVADRVLATLVEPITLDGETVRVRTSIGIATARAGVGADTDVLRRADIAMYQAKARGGNQFIIAPATMS